MDNAQKRERRTRETAMETACRWFTEAEIALAGLTRHVSVIAMDPATGRFFVSRHSANLIRAALGADAVL